MIGRVTLSGEFARDAFGAIPTRRPNESIENYCSRLFNGKTFQCRICDAEIDWLGVCDECDAKREEESTPVSRTIAETLTASGVPSRYSSWTLAGVQWPSGVNAEALKTWAGDPAFLTVAGPVGSGKSGLAAAMARQWVENGQSVRWRHVPDLLDQLREAEGETSSSAPEVLRSVMDFGGLLVLDDLGACRVSPYVAERLYQIIDSRSREARPLLVTSNLPPVAATGRRSLADIDPRIGSRLAEGRVVRWVAPDRRLKG